MKSKKIQLIIGTIVGVIVVGALTTTILTKLFPQDDTAEVSAPSISSAEEIIKDIKKPGAIDALATSYTENKTTTTGLADINYTQKYLVIQPASDFALFVHKDATKASNDAAVVSEIESFLASKGLTKVEPTSSIPSPYTLFDSDITTCQVLSLSKMNDRAASLTIGCIKKETITDTFKSVDSLLALYTKSSSKELTPTTIKPVSFSEGNKTLTTLNVYGPEDKATSLLFAAIDNDWEYLGERPLSTGTTQASPTGIDRSLSPELKAKIANPKYEGFLTKYVR